ncbi:MAG: hypothetical protein ACREFN_16595, partial [Acetobacteraceae bacterium]
MLGLLPVTDPLEHTAIEKTIELPLQPAAPPGVIALGPGHPFPSGAADAPTDADRNLKPWRNHALARETPRRYAASHASSSGR